jgi:hypothetical protein
MMPYEMRRAYLKGPLRFNRPIIILLVHVDGIENLRRFEREALLILKDPSSYVTLNTLAETLHICKAP